MITKYHTQTLNISCTLKRTPNNAHTHKSLHTFEIDLFLSRRCGRSSICLFWFLFLWFLFLNSICSSICASHLLLHFNLFRQFGGIPALVEAFADLLVQCLLSLIGRDTVL